MLERVMREIRRRIRVVGNSACFREARLHHDLYKGFFNSLWTMNSSNRFPSQDKSLRTAAIECELAKNKAVKAL
jgi:hypothetical protein